MSLEIVLISELIEGWLVILGLTPASDPLEDSLCSSECYIYILNLVICITILCCWINTSLE